MILSVFQVILDNSTH